MTLPGNERYARQTMLPEIGEEGQRRLAASAVLIVGLEGTGFGRGAQPDEEPAWAASGWPTRPGFGEQPPPADALHRIADRTPEARRPAEQLAALSSATRFDLYPED